MSSNKLSSFEVSRRSFLKKISLLAASSGAVTAAPWLKVVADENQLLLNGNERARIGIIGVGSRGRALLLNLKEIPSAEIVAVCDDYAPHYQRALRLTDGKAKAFKDYRELLSMGGLDAVVIATPLHEHSKMSIDALDAGLHVMCEKSMARTIDDCKSMVDIQQRTGKILQIGHQRLFNPVYLEAIQRIRAGEIGDVTQVRAFWHRNGSWRRPVPAGASYLERKINWRLYREYSAGLITELGSHQLQIANWVFNDVPERVMGSGSLCYWRDGREVFDQVALIYDYSDGRKLIYDSLIANKFHGLEEQILGSLGTIQPEINRIYSETPPPAPGIRQLVHDIEKGLFESIPIGGASWIPETAVEYHGETIVDGYHQDTLLQMEAFVAAVIRGKPYPGLLREAYHASIAVLLGEQAMELGKPVEWPKTYTMPKTVEPHIGMLSS